VRHNGTTVIDDVLFCGCNSIFFEMNKGTGNLVPVFIDFSYHRGFERLGMAVQRVNGSSLSKVTVT
jgi:hypothetical protein